MSANLFTGAVLGFLSGIVCRSLFYMSAPASIFLVALSAVAMLFYARYKRKVYVVVAITLITSSIGITRVAMVPMEAPAGIAQQFGLESTISGKIITDPDIRENSQRLLVENSAGSRVLIVAPRFPEVRYGESIVVEGRIEPPSPFATDGGRVFRYDRFLAKDGVFAVMHEASIQSVLPRETILDNARGSLADIKYAFTRAIGASLPEPHASLAAGMLLGGKQGLGDALVDAFTVAGLVHIVVLSGYNIMIIAEAVMRVLGSLPRRLAFSAAATAIAAFVLAAGAGSAALRAGVMAVLALAARATGRTYDVFRALGFAVVLMLMWNPLLLAFDPGFQLSIAATIGLILGAPIVEKRLTVVRSEFMREILSATIAAQIFVLPLLLYQTGSLSMVSLFANALVLPFVPLAMFLSFGASVTVLIVPIFGTLAGLPAYIVLEYVIRVTELLASLPLAQVIVPPFPFALVPLIYALLGYAVFVLGKR